MQGVAQPLNTVNKDCHGSDIKQRLQCAADVDSEQEHHVHHQQEHRQAEKTVEDHGVHRPGKAAWLGGEGVAGYVANGGDALIAGIGNVQGRVVQFIVQPRKGGIQILRGITGIGAAVDIAFQHLQAEPVTLFERHAVRHLLSKDPGFPQQRLGVVHQLHVGIAAVAVNRQLESINAARAGGDQRHHRAAQAGGEGIDVDTDLLLFRNIEHVQRHHAGDTQLQQL